MSVGTPRPGWCPSLETTYRFTGFNEGEKDQRAARGDVRVRWLFRSKPMGRVTVQAKRWYRINGVPRIFTPSNVSVSCVQAITRVIVRAGCCLCWGPRRRAQATALSDVFCGAGWMAGQGGGCMTRGRAQEREYDM